MPSYSNAIDDYEEWTWSPELVPPLTDRQIDAGAKIIADICDCTMSAARDVAKEIFLVTLKEMENAD